MKRHDKAPNSQSISAKSGRKAAWRHPTKKNVSLPYTSAAAIALMESGVTDYSVIASALRIDVADVERIDNTEDEIVRKLAVEGMPHGEYFKLHGGIRCPKCNSWIVITPCMTCRHYLQR